MNIISRIQFPRTLETSSLYINCTKGAYLDIQEENAEVTLTENSVISLNTYFNSFYETFYAKYTDLESLYYLLRLEGDFQISLYREKYGVENREITLVKNFENCQLSQPVKIAFPDNWRSEDAGRIYLEITCLSESGLFSGGNIATEQPKTREVSLGIISCTFKKEIYIKNTVNAIFKDELLQDKQLEVFIVDNGKTLKQDEFSNSKVKLIPNRNVGGSGGFTRGLIQALQVDTHTHFLFMDDDIELESESLYRLFPLYEYAKQDFAIAGSMLDLYNKHILYEAGALYGQSLDSNGKAKYNPFGVICLKPKLNLEDSNVTNLLLSEESPDYGGFWFFSFSRETVKEIGLPLPLFIKIDDMEFGLRIKKSLAKSIVAFPGIAVWHEPFYAKNPIWDNYYTYRNHLVANSIHSSSSYLNMVKFVTKSILYSIFSFDYNTALMMINGFEDYMKGPEFIESTDPEKLHGSVVALSKSYDIQTKKFDSSPGNQFNDNSNITSLKKIISLLSLNGHLLPKLLLSNKPAYSRKGSDSSDFWYSSFGKKQIIFLREGNDSISQHDMNRSVAIKLLARWLQIIMKNTNKWSYVNSEWKNAFNRLKSIEFWRKYLQLSEQS